MDYKTFAAIKRLAKRNNLEYLSTKLNSLFQQGGLPACQTFIDNALNEIEKGNLKATDQIQETTTEELLDGLAWELDQAENDPDFKFAKNNRPQKHSIGDDLGYIDETDPNNANDHTINSKIELANIEERVKGLISTKKKVKESNDDLIEKVPELPQTRVKEITDKLLKGANEKGIFTHEESGKKYQYQVIHEKNTRWKGPNRNQIYKYFSDVHPELVELVSKNGFDERIKRAIDYTKLAILYQEHHTC